MLLGFPLIFLKSKGQLHACSFQIPIEKSLNSETELHRKKKKKEEKKGKLYISVALLMFLTSQFSKFAATQHGYGDELI